MIQAISKCVAGLDVHKKNVVCTLLSEQENGDVVPQTREFATFRRDLMDLAMWLKDSGVELVAMESTGIYWKQVYEAIEDVMLKASVVNARHVKNVPGRKTDVKDSLWLSELTRCGLLNSSFIPPRDFRQLRLVTRYRKKLSGILSAERNRLHKLLEAFGIKLSCVVSNIDGVSSNRMLKGILEDLDPEEIADMAVGKLRKKKSALLKALEGYRLSDRDRFLLSILLSHIKWIEEHLVKIDEQIVSAMEPYKKQWELLQTLPGVNQISAAIILSELGIDMEEFKTAGNLCSWAGMCPGNNESAGKRKSGKTRKGNKYIRTILCETANAAIKTNSQFKGIYKGLVIRRGHKRAIVAIGHRMLKIIYSMLKTGSAYKDPEIDYEEMMVKKNAPRWIKALKKYGYVNKEGGA
jgi:transposase